MQAETLSPEKALLAQGVLQEVEKASFLSRHFGNQHFDKRYTLSEDLGQDIYFITAKTLTRLCGQTGISLAQLCASGLLMGRLVCEGKDPIPVAEQAEIIAGANKQMKTLKLGPAVLDKNGAPLARGYYAGDVLAMVSGFHDGPRPINHDKVQDDLWYLESNDSLFFNLSRLKELAAGSQVARPAVQAACARG